MRSFFIIFIFGLSLVGCKSSWYIEKAKEKCPECFELDTSIQEIVFKLDTTINIDTTFLIYLPTDTVRIEKLIPKNVKLEPVYEKNGIINVEVSANNGKLEILSYLDSTMWYRLQDSIKIKNAIIKRNKTIIYKQNIVIKENETFKGRLKYWVKIGIIAFSIIGLASLIIFIRYNKPNN